MAHSSRARAAGAPEAGFTLVELMISGAVALIAVIAATATLTTQLKAQGDSTTKNAISIQIALAQVILERQLSNATMGFSDPRYGFRLRNNVAASLPNGDGTSILTAAPGDTTAGVLVGTDVIEAAWAEPTTRRAGTVNACPGASCTLGTGTGLVQLATTEPLTIAEATILSSVFSESGPLLLFTNQAGTSCLGRATSVTPGVSTAMTFNYYDADLNSITPSATINCPAAGMSVFGADVRRRYMIYQDAGGTTQGIYTQDMKTTSLAYDVPKLLVAGIEDMQVMPSIQNADGTFSSCNDGSTPTDAGTTCSLSATNDYLVRSALVTLTGNGTKPLALAGMVRPAVYDHAAGTVSGFYRTTLELSLFLPNSFLGSL